MNIQTDQGLLLQAYEYLSAGNPRQAKPVLEDALSYDLENREILFTIRCVNFWLERLSSLDKLDTAFERGEMLILQWGQFLTFLFQNGTHEEDMFPRSMHAVCKGVFSLALTNYESLFNEHNPAHRAEIFRRAGLCYKKLGVYDKALEYLGKTGELVSITAAVYAEMADCYALCGDDRRAKVLFREAFFLGPQDVDIIYLDSELIKTLIEQVSAKGFSGAVLQEWIPVYAVLFGIFNIKREMRATEIGRLKQTIYALENEMKEESCDRKLLLPRLINCYFWLVDHYLMVHDDRIKVNEILLKIKLLDADVYKLYTM